MRSVEQAVVDLDHDGLLDPRCAGAGAPEVMALLARGGARRVVYISSDVASLARDAGRLVHEHDYRLLAAGVMDMFPHSAHVGSLALMERDA